MAHSYQSAYPSDASVDPEIIQFFEKFYTTSDDPGALDEYVDLFEKDAVFILASKKSVGHDEIRVTRKGMWDAVAARKHTIPKVFPFTKGSDEFMLYGVVELRLKNGSEATLDWAGRAQVAKSPDDGKRRMKFYQIYLDTGAAAAYKK